MKTNQSESFVVAQSSSTPSVSSPQKIVASFPFWPVALTAVVTIGVTLFMVKFLSKNNEFIKLKDRAIKAFNKMYSVEPTQEFAIGIEVSSIRTLDHLQATVQATIYVYIEDMQEAKKFLFEGDRVSPVAVDKAVKKRAESRIRDAASTASTLNELQQKRGDIIFRPVNGDQLETLLQKDLAHLGLNVTGIAIGEIHENFNYTATNYFDAQAIQHRTTIIQDAILATRKKELETEKEIHEFELEIEKQMKEYKLCIGRDIREKEWEISSDLEQIQLSHQEKHLDRLVTLERFEKSKIDHELNIELHKNEKEKELQHEVETSKLLIREHIETTELEIREKIESFRSQVNQVLKNREVEAAISIIQIEQKRLGHEIDRAKLSEELTTEIEQAISNREKLKAEIAADSVENKAKIIERLANADSIRHNLIPATDADRTVHLIREILPELPKFVEIAQALAPKAGILGDSNIYTFQNGNSEDINKLMFSTSGMLLIQSILDGKLGNLLLEMLRSFRNDDKSKGEDRSEV